MEKKQLRVYYDGEADPKIDEAIEKTLKSLGYHRWASGYSFVENKRDLAFER